MNASAPKARSRVDDAEPVVIVRRAEPAEYDAVADIVDAAFLAGPYGHLPITPERRRLQRDSAGRAAAGALLVAVGAGGELLGTSTLLRAGTGDSRLAVADEAELRLLAVAPAARGRGVGELLVHGSVAEARGWGASAVVLDTGALNLPAQRLYERAGFRRVPRRETAYENAALGMPVVYELPLA